MADANTWLPVDLVRQSLSLAAVPEDEAHVERCRDAAMRLAERITERPLTGAVARFVLPRGADQQPLETPPLRDVDAGQGKDGLASIGWWPKLPAGRAALTPIEDGNADPDVAVVERVVEHGEAWDAPTPYRIWPQAAGWPAAAGGFEVRMNLAVNPTLNEDLRQACLMLCRVYYAGMAALTADERRGLQLVLPGVTAWLGSDLQ